MNGKQAKALRRGGSDRKGLSDQEWRKVRITQVQQFFNTETKKNEERTVSFEKYYLLHKQSKIIFNGKEYLIVGKKDPAYAKFEDLSRPKEEGNNENENTTH